MQNGNETGMARIIPWGMIAGIVAGGVGGLLFSLFGAILVLFRDGGPTGLAPFISAVAFGILAGGVIGLAISVYAAATRTDRNWTLFGAALGTIFGPIPILAIGIGSILSGRELGGWAALLAMALIAGAMGGAVGGWLFKERVETK